MKTPFGNYEKGTTGCVLNSLVDVGVPMHIVESVGVGSWLISYNSRMMATFRFFEGIEQALFYFRDPAYSAQPTSVNEDGFMVPQFRLLMNARNNPALVITGALCSFELVCFLRELISSKVNESNQLIIDCEPEVLSMPVDNNQADWEIHIEFRESGGAQAFVDFVNKHFVYAKETTQ